MCPRARECACVCVVEVWQDLRQVRYGCCAATYAGQGRISSYVWTKVGVLRRRKKTKVQRQPQCMDILRQPRVNIGYSNGQERKRGEGEHTGTKGGGQEGRRTPTAGSPGITERCGTKLMYMVSGGQHGGQASAVRLLYNGGGESCVRGWICGEGKANGEEAKMERSFAKVK